MPELSREAKMIIILDLTIVSAIRDATKIIKIAR